MVETGQPRIRRIDFASPYRLNVPVEVVGREALLARMAPGFALRPARLTFDMAILVHDGAGRHLIDFQYVDLVPGRLIRVRPGQVHRWDLAASAEATVALVRVPTRNRSWGGEEIASCDLDAGSLKIAESLFEALAVEQHRFDGSEASTRLMVHLFGAIEALFDLALPPSTITHESAAYPAFREAIESNLGTSLHARDYQQKLGYSERTITRACQRATGLTAKGVLNQRIVLEAKRMLAHTDESAATIGRVLGFSEATNFHKFFVRHTSQRPAEFRANARHVPLPLPAT